MSVCRTCLSKNDLRPIFSDKDLTGPRAKELYTVTGIKINPDDGLTQLICVPCNNLVIGALKLREQSSTADKILKKSMKPDINGLDIKISKQEDGISQTDNSQQNIVKKISQQKCLKLKSEEKIKTEYGVRIEDFESSDDSQMNNIILEDLESDSGEEKRVRIEDFESSDSFDEEDLMMLKEESKKCFKFNWETKEKEFLDREKRKAESKELDNKLMSLAVTPYDPGGPIRCTLCSKEVRNAQNFKCHAKTHFEPQNACEECGKKFVNRSHMRYHQQRVHGRRKRLACGLCPYRAVDPQQLQNHNRATHTGERPYICDVCGDAFRMRANIAQHMRKHFGVRNLQCERCPAMFRSRSELTNHQNRVHNHIYTYYCYLCNDTYKRPASVRKHLVNIHGVTRNQQLPIRCVKTTRRTNDKND